MSDLIRMLPKDPKQKIKYVVYNEDLIEPTKRLIIAEHGLCYLQKHCEVVAAFSGNANNYYEQAVYIDPLVYTYLNSWND